MSGPPKKPPGSPPDKGGSSFTVDADDTGMAEMPSVTKLLNRKSLGLGTPKKKSKEPSARNLPPAMEQAPAAPPPPPGYGDSPAASAPPPPMDLQPPPAAGPPPISMSAPPGGPPPMDLPTPSIDLAPPPPGRESLELSSSTPPPAASPASGGPKAPGEISLSIDSSGSQDFQLESSSRPESSATPAHAFHRSGPAASLG